MSTNAENVQRILKTVPSRYRGPGGAIAVLKDGNLVGQHVWGYADMDKRIPMSPHVLIPICSITKQFTSALLIDLAKSPPSTMEDQKTSFQEQMQTKLQEMLPSEIAGQMTVDNLVDMCSGLRDYWALCTLQGSSPETPYLIDEHNPDMIRRIKGLQFGSGTEYSYSNTNFNIIERLIEQVTKTSLADLLPERIFGPAKMTTARIAARTDRLPPPIIGYEGSQDFGFFPAPNFIEWSADAGMAASLTDMIAYERYFDSKYTDPDYRAILQPRAFKNGAPSSYRYGLGHSKLQGLAAVGHGGALRGFKLHRRYVESERLSVVVLFNHMADAGGATSYIIKKILNISDPPTPNIEPASHWFGAFLDQDTQLSVRVTSGGKGKVKVLYVRAATTLNLVDDSHAKSTGMQAEIKGDELVIHSLDDNRVLNAKRLKLSADSSDIPPVQGTYQCDETESTFICEGEGNMLYGLFNGPFGRGPPHLMTHLGEDVWVLADPRAMDDQPPGDWTLVFVRDGSGNVTKVTIGCWLARKLDFARVK